MDQLQPRGRRLYTTHMASDWVIYGATGYTGTLLAEEAVRRGHRPLLCGRSAQKLRPLAERLQLPFTAVSLDDAKGLRAAFAGKVAVLHAAGPFVVTSAPIARRVHRFWRELPRHHRRAARLHRALRPPRRSETRWRRADTGRGLRRGAL